MYYIKIPTVRFTGLVRPDPQGEYTYICLLSIYLSIYLLSLHANMCGFFTITSFVNRKITDLIFVTLKIECVSSSTKVDYTITL